MEVRSILLPTDFSECARHAVPVAAELARLLGAGVVCLHVVEPVVPPVGWTPVGEPLPVADFGAQLDEAATRELPAFTGGEEFAGLEVEVERPAVGPGEPVAQGQVLGTVSSLDGARLLQTITAPAAGVPLFVTSSPAVAADGLLLGLGAT